METVLEFSGMVFTMLGAFLITSKKENTRYYGLISFIIANYVVFTFATMKGLFPLQVQMIFFLILTAPALKAYSKNWNKIKTTLIIFTIVYSIALYIIVDFKIVITSIPVIEIMAATIAVTGSYLQRYKESDIRIISFMMFFLADIIYVGISIEKSMLFFGIQSLFFWYTSVKGIKSELEGIRFIDWSKNSLKKLTIKG